MTSAARNRSRYFFGPCCSAIRKFCIAIIFCCTASSARAGDWQWHIDGGGELNNDPHGIFDLGFRNGALSLSLFTDTLEVRWAPELLHGRWWVAARVEGFAAGLLISPWTNGAPDPSRALIASYGGAEAGYVRYLPGSFYAGFSASERVYFFFHYPGSSAVPPGPTSLLTVDAAVGRYTPESHVWVRAGFDLEGLTAQPHVALEATYRPSLTVAPRAELRAGWAQGQTDLTRTRLGGENPYVVPLAGAAWAEWWVESYVAGRLGVTWKNRWAEVGLAADAAAFEGRIVSGFALLARATWSRYFVDTTFGYAPWIVRQPGYLPLSLFVLAGTDWHDMNAKK